MFTVRHLVEKMLEMQGGIVSGFVDLEKAYGTVLREMVMTMLIGKGVP